MEDVREILASSHQLIGDNPHPIGMALEENQMEEAPPNNPTHPITSDGHCLLQVQNCIRCLPEMLNFMNLKLKVKVKSQKLTLKVR